MDVSVVGAGGTMGRQIAINLVQEGLLPVTSRLQLVGRRGGRSERTVYGLAADLADGHAEYLPEIDVAMDPEAILGDIIIVAAGRTVEPEDEERPTRRDLARCNAPLFESMARAIATHAHGEEIILVLSNPVELGVEIFARHHDPRRVIGLGGFLDTLRFRREIAYELGIRRQAVQGLVLGEHGVGMAPCWSTVWAYGFESVEGRQALASLARPGPPRAEALRAALELLETRGPAEAYAHVARYPADLRTFVKPFVTHFTGQRTPVGSAEMVSRLVETIVEGREMLCAAQIKLMGDFLDIHGVTGAPVLLSARGIERVEPLELTGPEAEAVRAAATAFDELLASL